MNPLKSYINWIKRMEPKEPNYELLLNVEIKKGQKEGKVVIPCALQGKNYSIDFNPSLIRKKDKKIIKKYPTNEKIKFNPEEEEVILTKDEKEKGYELKELDRCPSCGLKTVIAELKETTYHNDPVIGVKLSDPVKENLVVPVKMGIYLESMIFNSIFTIIAIFGLIYFIFKAEVVHWIGWAFIGMIILFIPKVIYRDIKTLGFLIKNRKNIRRRR